MGTLKKCFGANVKYIRKLKHITQERLSELIDIDLRQLARIEAGESFATAETIEKLSNTLDVSFSTLFKIEKPLTLSEKTTLDAIELRNTNLAKLEKRINKISNNSKKTDFVCLAIDALEKKSVLEKLKFTIMGIDLQ